MGDMTHFDDAGKPRMVDVGGKPVTVRRAVAEGWVDLPQAVYEALTAGSGPKGDPFPIAQIGGIAGAKRTSELIPLCHNIRLDAVSVACDLDHNAHAVRIRCEASANDVTGVEMEALTGVSIAALVFYDMCKGVDKGMIIRGIRLLAKSGGKSGDWQREEDWE